MNNKKLNERQKKHIVVSKKFMAGMITACALLGVGFITTGTLYGISIANKKDGGSSEKVKELENKIIELDKQITVKETEIKEKTEQIKTKEAEIETKKEEIVKKEAIIKDLEGKGAEYEKTITDLRAQIAAGQKEITDLKASVDKLKTDLEAAQAEVEKAQTEIKSLQDQLAAEEGKVVVMFADKDFNVIKTFKIASGSTISAAEAPTPTSGYAWKDFVAGTTKFTAHTLIHETAIISVSYDNTSLTSLNLTLEEHAGTSLIDGGKVEFTLATKSEEVNFNVIAKVNDKEVYKSGDYKSTHKESCRCTIYSNDISDFSKLTKDDEIVISVKKLSISIDYIDKDIANKGKLEFNNTQKTIEDTAQSLTIYFTYTDYGKCYCNIHLCTDPDDPVKTQIKNVDFANEVQKSTTFTFDLSSATLTSYTKLYVVPRIY